MKPTRDEMDSIVEDHTTPQLMWNQALAYLTAATEIARLSDDRKPRFNTPQLALACHGLELALKSFLFAKGLPLKTIRKDLGHDLLKALKACQIRGLSFPPESISTTLEYLSPRWMEHLFRYFHLHDLSYIDERDAIDVGLWGLAATENVAAPGGMSHLNRLCAIASTAPRQV